MKDYTITLCSTVTIPLSEGTLRDPGMDTERLVSSILALHDLKSWEAISQNTLLKNPESVHLNTMAISNTLFTEPNQSSKILSVDGSGPVTIAHLCLKEFVSLLKGFKDASSRSFAISRLFRGSKSLSYVQEASDVHASPKMSFSSMDNHKTNKRERLVPDYPQPLYYSNGRHNDVSE
jgi:hypothetical protein